MIYKGKIILEQPFVPAHSNRMDFPGLLIKKAAIIPCSTAEKNSGPVTPAHEENLKDLLFIRIKESIMTLNFRLPLIPFFFLMLLLLSAGCMEGPGQVPVPAPTTAPTAAVTTTGTISPAGIAGEQTATREEMVAFVQEAVAYANLNGKDQALAEFSNPNGSFFRSVLYIYAYDYNGTTIAHPVNPEKIGINRLYEKDAEGNLFITDLRQAAYNGTGFTTYTYINPVHNNAAEKKLGYVMKVDERWWLGSGIYFGPADTPAPTQRTIIPFLPGNSGSPYSFSCRNAAVHGSATPRSFGCIHMTSSRIGMDIRYTSHGTDQILRASTSRFTTQRQNTVWDGYGGWCTGKSNRQEGGTGRPPDGVPITGNLKKKDHSVPSALNRFR